MRIKHWTEGLGYSALTCVEITPRPSVNAHVTLSNMHVDRTTMLLPKRPDRADLESLLIQIASPRSVDIRFINASNHASTDPTGIDVRMNDFSGAAECELDIHWNGNCKIGDDAVGFRVVQLIKCDIVLRNYDESPTSWMLLRIGHEIENLIVDEHLLSNQRRLSYDFA